MINVIDYTAQIAPQINLTLSLLERIRKITLMKRIFDTRLNILIPVKLL